MSANTKTTIFIGVILLIITLFAGALTLAGQWHLAVLVMMITVSGSYVQAEK